MKNLRIKTLALVLATFGLGVNAQTTFEEISADLNKAGGVYLAYPKVEAKQTPAPKGYKPFYVSHYGRRVLFRSTWFPLSFGGWRLSVDYPIDDES